MVRQNWQLFKQEVSKDLCEDIVKNFSQLPVVDGGTFNSAKDHRKSKVRWVQGEHGLKDHLIRYAHLANTVFNIDVHQVITELQFTEYDAEYQGKYDLHHDVDWQADTNLDRKISVVVQLSNPNDYEGGQFSFSEIENPKQDDLNMQGTIIAFPSYLQHQVSPVTSGVRHSLVFWLSGPRWR